MKQSPIIPFLKFQSQSLPFNVQILKTVAEEPDDINEGPHSHNYYEMVWLIKGKASLYIDMQEYVIAPGTIFCIKPHQAHEIQL